MLRRKIKKKRLYRPEPANTQKNLSVRIGGMRRWFRSGGLLVLGHLLGLAVGRGNGSAGGGLRGGLFRGLGGRMWTRLDARKGNGGDKYLSCFPNGVDLDVFFLFLCVEAYTEHG
jgi:hypothetical protein